MPDCARPVALAAPLPETQISVPLEDVAPRMFPPVYASVSAVVELTTPEQSTTPTTRSLVADAVVATASVPASALYPTKRRRLPSAERCMNPSDVAEPLWQTARLPLRAAVKGTGMVWTTDRKSTRLNSSHVALSRM